MACCLCFSQGSKTWRSALLVPILFFATLISSSQYGASSLVLLIMSLSTLFLFTLSKQKPIFIVDSSLNEQENCSSDDKLRQVQLALAQTEIGDSTAQDSLYSESESCNNNSNIVDHQYYSTSSNTSSSEDDDQDDEDQYSSSEHSNAAEYWPNHYNSTMTGQKKLDYYCSEDDSISDEESLIEIAIPSGRHFVSPQKDFMKCCKVVSTDRHFPMFHHKDFLADMNEMNEEDNLIEIDIYMGSIKCSSFR